MTNSAARDVITTLGMDRHPEGGWFVQTFEDDPASDGRARSTAIYYLLEAGETSHWHRIDAVEIWHFYAGSPLRLSVSNGIDTTSHTLGPSLPGGERPQVVVPQGAWQSAASLGAWTLVGCTVAPGFRFSGFELAEQDWMPGKR